MDKRAECNALAMLEMWDKTMRFGDVIYPRGEEVRELPDYKIELLPQFPFQSFEDRRYNIDYFKAEMLWKLGANKYDESIKMHAKMWESVQNPDGTFNSNYGQYWFGEQKGFWNVVEELIRDQDSRRAVIPMLSKDHMRPETRDTVCTESVGFRIRGGQLFMSVHMRSSDQVFGLGTDIPTFSFLMHLVHGALKSVYNHLELGTLTITAMSSHIYSRHYEMINRVLDKGLTGYDPIQVPWEMSSAESLMIVSSRGNLGHTPKSSQVCSWFMARSSKG